MSIKKQVKRENGPLTDTALTSLARERILKKVDHLHQQIFQASGQTPDPLETLVKAYERLCDEEKICFLFAGGAPQLFRYQHHIREQDGREHPSNQATGGLPIIC
jgi:hypothetical protein